MYFIEVPKSSCSEQRNATALVSTETPRFKRNILYLTSTVELWIEYFWMPNVELSFSTYNTPCHRQRRRLLNRRHDLQWHSHIDRFQCRKNFLCSARVFWIKFYLAGGGRCTEVPCDWRHSKDSILNAMQILRFTRNLTTFTNNHNGASSWKHDFRFSNLERMTSCGI